MSTQRCMSDLISTLPHYSNSQRRRHRLAGWLTQHCTSAGMVECMCGLRAVRQLAGTFALQALGNIIIGILIRCSVTSYFSQNGPWYMAWRLFFVFWKFWLLSLWSGANFVESIKWNSIVSGIIFSVYLLQIWAQTTIFSCISYENS